MVDLCGTGRLSATSAGTLYLTGGSLIGGGRLVGRVVAGCELTFPARASNSVLWIQGSFEALSTLVMIFGVRITNMNQTQSSSDRIIVSESALLRGDIRTTWTWQGTQTQTLYSPVSYSLISYHSSSIMTGANTTALTSQGVDTLALRRNITSTSYSVEFVGCPDGYQGTHICSPCSSGRWSVRANNSLPLMCRDCPVGRYQDAVMQSACKLCTPGNMADTPGTCFVYVRVCVYAFMCVYMYVYIYIHTYMLFVCKYAHEYDR